MKYATASIALAVAALVTGHAQAADVGKTREQVRAELAEARRTGDIAASKDMGTDEFASGAGRKLNELNPAAYPAKPAVAGKTREQVRAELAEARRTGDIAASKDMGTDEFASGAGRKLNELNPAAYPAKPAVAGKTREQVRAELAEARRTGDIAASKDMGTDEFASGAGRKLNELNPAAYPAKPAVAGKTREQVRAELAEARRTGDIAASKDMGTDEFASGAGRKLNELNPAAYPAKPAVAGQPREQARAELAEARRTGDIAASKDMGTDEFASGAGRKLNELNPAAYPAKPAVAGKTREQVRAQLAEAQRTGDIVASKDTCTDEYASGAGRKLNELFPNLYPATRTN